MASYKRFVLPALRHTSRPTQGPKKVSSLHRGVTGVKGSSSEIVLPDAEPSSSLQPSTWFDISSLSEPTTSTTLIQEPTENEIHCKSSVAGWDKIRE